MDWCSDDKICKNSIETVKRYNKSWTAGTDIYKDLNDDLFDGRVTESFYCDIPFTRESWHGRMCACRGTLASMSREQFERWSEAHMKMLEEYPESFTIKHKVYISYFKVENKHEV